MKNLLLFLTSFLFLMACQKEENPKSEETDIPQTSVFATDDGATALNGTKMENFKQLLEKTNLKYISTPYEPHLTASQISEIKKITDNLTVQGDASKTFKNIFDWVHKNIRYNLSDNEPYAVFRNRVAVCQGYANLLKVMLETQNIPAIVVYGNLKDPNARGANDTSLGHAWNYVLINGKWMVSDPTNNRNFKADEFNKYAHLEPMYLNTHLFEDDNFTYAYNEGRLSIRKVKQGNEKLIVPFSVMGFRITAFNPSQELPNTIKEIYIGKNITSLGKNIVGLKEYAGNVEKVLIDIQNPQLEEYKGVIYQKGESLPYLIPNKLQKMELKGIEKVGKNTIFGHNSVTEIIFSKDTKRIEAYAVESCPNLTQVRVHKDTEIQENAFYRCSPNLKIVKF